MIPSRVGDGMGRFAIDFEVGNYGDMVKARNGLLDPKKVRRETIRGWVGSGATRLVLPRAVAKRLGLPSGEKIKVRYADGRMGTRDTAEEVYVEILGRHGIFTALVEPKRRSALVGAIVLEDLDFMVDCTSQRLVPRDPRFVVSEIE